MQRVHTAPLPQNTLKNAFVREELQELVARTQYLHEQLGTTRFFTDPSFERRNREGVDRRSGQERRHRLPLSNGLNRRAMGERRLPAAERIRKLEEMLATTTAHQMELQARLQNSY